MRKMLNIEDAMSKKDDVINVTVKGRSMVIKVRPFFYGDSKQAVGKVLEEAAEVFGAWQGCKHGMGTEPELGCMYCDRCVAACPHRLNMVYEMADLITAICNLAYRNGIGGAELQDAIFAVELSNKSKGRY